MFIYCFMANINSLFYTSNAWNQAVVFSHVVLSRAPYSFENHVSADSSQKLQLVSIQHEPPLCFLTFPFWSEHRLQKTLKPCSLGVFNKQMLQLQQILLSAKCLKDSIPHCSKNLRPTFYIYQILYYITFGTLKNEI